jgi:hypothetical protein
LKSAWPRRLEEPGRAQRQADIGSLISRIDALSAAVGFAPSQEGQPRRPRSQAPVVKKVARQGRRPLPLPAKKVVAKKAAAVKKAAAPAKKAAPVRAAEKAVAEVKVDRPERAAQGQGRWSRRPWKLLKQAAQA